MGLPVPLLVDHKIGDMGAEVYDTYHCEEDDEQCCQCFADGVHGRNRLYDSNTDTAPSDIRCQAQSVKASR
jgi:hypothetical protein